MSQSFCFILNAVEFQGELPCEVIPDHFFQRASGEQIRTIKERITNYIEPLFAPAYEFDLIPRMEGGGAEQKALPEQSWRYFVINFHNNNTRDILTLGYAASLLKNNLEFGFYVAYQPHGGTVSGWSAEFMSSFYKSFSSTHWNIKMITGSDLQEIGPTHAAIKMMESQHPNIFRAIVRFNYLRALPRRSTMLVIGYFSIIESLIAHKPRLQESLDSINHQLQSKLILLSKKFQRPLDYAAFFDTMKEKDIWKKLYAYRSAIAHDEGADFNSEFRVLKDQENIHLFLSEVVKLLLLFALREPVFLADLKNC